MNLSDLPARELARLDAVCLDYESRLRIASESEAVSDPAVDIDSLVHRYGGEHASVLRAELEAIRNEVKGESNPSSNKPNTSIIRDAPTEAMTPGDQGPLAQKTPAAAELSAAELLAAQRPKAGQTPGPEATSRVSDIALAADNLPPLGTEIGPYLLTSVLGRGGMGIVYRATDSRLDRSVAIKMLSVGGKHSNVLVERFQREAKAVAGLTHPNIVELFDVGVFQGLPYAVMEHLRGKTLLEHLHGIPGDRRVAPQQVRRWGLQLAEALTAAHERGVIHRDLKPENVMVMARASTARTISSTAKLQEEGNLKLFDFGLSRIGQSNPGASPTSDGHADPTDGPKSPSSISEVDSSTRVGMILGTPGYMAPEQARGDAITPATDVFALGCVLYEAFFGRPAFEGETPARRFAAVLEKQPLPDPVRRRDDVKLTDLILKMLAKDPAQRPAAADVVHALQVSQQATVNRNQGRTTSGQTAGSDEFVISRRRMIELGVGGIVGATLGTTLLKSSSAGRLSDIRSIGVLSFQEANSIDSIAINPPPGDDAASTVVPMPSGNQAFTPGELLSGLLVNELARIEGFTVPKFVPITAYLPSEFQAAAKLLEVDAIVTGTYSLSTPPMSQAIPQSKQIMNVNLEIISGKTGKLIEGITIPTSAGGNLIEQSALARDLAELIGRELSTGQEIEQAKDPEAFTCLIKGRIRSDPDSIDGLNMALGCFEHAISVDFNYAQAHAGLGLTAITLAARESGTRVGELIAMSQQATSRALSLAPDHPDARLAQAMLEYQVLNEFNSTEKVLDQLSQQFPSHWQIQHQAGWLKMIQFNEAAGLQLLRRSTGLHPASLFLKADLARANWFRGYPDRAKQAALEMLRSVSSSGNKFAKGLLIDLYEQSEDYASAAEVDPGISWSANQGLTGYHSARESRLGEIPYGPFGEAINSAILQIRRKDLSVREPADQLLARLISAQLPMLPLVLCKHPAFASMTLLEQAVETFPMLKIG